MRVSRLYIEGTLDPPGNIHLQHTIMLTNIYIYTYMYVRIHVCTYVCMYVRMYVCLDMATDVGKDTYICIYTYVGIDV